MISILPYGQVPNEAIFARTEPASKVEAVVSDILADVRRNGDAALYKYCRQSDRADLTSLEVTAEELDAAAAQVEPELLEVLRRAAANIEAFHALPWKVEDLEIIDGMLQQAKEIPVVLGGYYTTRHLTNAWNKVVINGVLLRDALEEAVEAINKELKMKQEEYGIY